MKRILQLLLLLILAGCGDSEENKPGQETQPPPESVWTEKMKEKILADFELGTDSAASVPHDDKGFIEVNKFRKGELKLKQYQMPDGRTIFEAYTANGGDFELRREYCGNGQLYFEGIFHNGDFYGLSTWWNCDGKIRKQGLKYRSKLFGKWTYWNESDSTYRQEDYGLMEHLDSLNSVDFKH